MYDPEEKDPKKEEPTEPDPEEAPDTDPDPVLPLLNDGSVIWIDDDGDYD
jgi:hypothetical protein